jgi:hydroxymethylglutaryl-CoA reductase (NADPH)
VQKNRVAKIIGERQIPKTIGKDKESDELEYKNNCENVIGSIKIPCGVAGPIKFLSKEFILPLATTEAALVASINRGCKLINLGAGLNVSSVNKGITRAPVYKIRNIKTLEFYKNWFNINKDLLQSEISKTSKHTKILKIEPKKSNGLLFVKFYFETGEAMGMNMATIACEAMNKIICTELRATCLALSSNYCSDKKLSLVNIKDGRGYKASAEITLSNSMIEEHLKCSPKGLWQTYKAKVQYGSKLAKAVCANCQQANFVAAIFIATGQDPAHISESSLGNTILKKTESGIQFRVSIPNLIIGIHGGGTKLSTQREALNLLNVESTEEFSKIIAIGILAAEISLLGSLAEGSLASIHDKYRK